MRRRPSGRGSRTSSAEPGGGTAWAPASGRASMPAAGRRGRPRPAGPSGPWRDGVAARVRPGPRGRGGTAWAPASGRAPIPAAADERPGRMSGPRASSPVRHQRAGRPTTTPRRRRAPTAITAAAGRIPAADTPPRAVRLRPGSGRPPRPPTPTAAPARPRPGTTRTRLRPRPTQPDQAATVARRRRPSSARIARRMSKRSRAASTCSPCASDQVPIARSGAASVAPSGVSA